MDTNQIKESEGARYSRKIQAADLQYAKGEITLDEYGKICDDAWRCYKVAVTRNMFSTFGSVVV